MKEIYIPEDYNYMAVFLTFRCNYSCHYCITRFGEASFDKEELDGRQWVSVLNRLVTRDDLPLTLQGGEPSLHKDFIYIINNVDKNIKLDVLTNLSFDVDEFIKNVNPERINRDAPYAPMRVSFHPESMNLDEVMKKTLKMQEAGFKIGLYGVLHPKQQKVITGAQKRCKEAGIDFRVKDFLGFYDGKLYGTYRYEEACFKKNRKSCLCRTTELILSPQGKVYRCHSDLYEGRPYVGDILDYDFQIEDKYRSCDYFGHCNPCDIKVTTNRFQRFGHTSVDIKDIKDIVYEK